MEKQSPEKTGHISNLRLQQEWWLTLFGDDMEQALVKYSVLDCGASA
jgi:hypothetical protein